MQLSFLIIHPSPFCDFEALQLVFFLKIEFRSKLKKKTIVGYFNGVHLHRSDVFRKVKKSVYLVEGVYPGILVKYQNKVLEQTFIFR